MNTLELTLQRKTDSGYPVVAALTCPSGFLPLRREGMLNLDIAALSELQYEPLAYGTAIGKVLVVDIQPRRPQLHLHRRPSCAPGSRKIASNQCLWELYLLYGNT